MCNKELIKMIGMIIMVTISIYLYISIRIFSLSLVIIFCCLYNYFVTGLSENNRSIRIKIIKYTFLIIPIMFLLSYLSYNFMDNLIINIINTQLFPRIYALGVCILMVVTFLYDNILEDTKA